MTKPKRQAKKPKARTIWVNAHDWFLDTAAQAIVAWPSKEQADLFCNNKRRTACVEFRQVIKKGKKR